MDELDLGSSAIESAVGQRRHGSFAEHVRDQIDHGASFVGRPGACEQLGERRHRFGQALELGAASAGSALGPPPVPLDSAIVFAPAGEIVPHALAALGPGGTLALAGIHMSDIPQLTYERHLFREKTLTSVTSNTRADGEEFLRLAARLGVRATVTPYPFEQARQALIDLANDAVHGAAVLDMSS